MGYACPQGFDFLQTQAGPVCVYRGHAPCLGGQTNWQTGDFQCTAWDDICPPGSAAREGHPHNWCFIAAPSSGARGDARVGALFSEKSSDAAKHVILGVSLVAVALIWVGARSARSVSPRFAERVGGMLPGLLTGRVPRTAAAVGFRSRPVSDAASFRALPAYDAYQG